MSVTVENPNANVHAREMERAANPPPAGTRRPVPAGKTALAAALKPEQITTLAERLTDRYTNLYTSLGPWREKMARYERIADENRQDRRGAKDQTTEEGTRTIFEKSNHSLGLVSGFADFAYAQARDDLFGTSPFLAATPVGPSDGNQADLVTKHASWKIGQTNTRNALIDSLRLACDLGTGFVKTVWRREIESYETIQTIAHGPDGKPILTATGAFLTADDPLPAGVAIASWKEMLVKQTLTVWDNLVSHCVDYNDIAFDQCASELDLLHTDVFHKIEIGLLDAKSIYKLTDEQYRAALDLVMSARSGKTKPREHRGENRTTTTIDLLEESNPIITLIDGYVRCNPFGTTEPPTRIYAVFSPEIQQIFHLDYLPNHTPGGLLPIHPVRCFKVPNRICGKGYLEKFEDVENYIDQEFNAVSWRDKMAANPLGGYIPDLFAEDVEDGIVMEPHKLYKLKPDADLAKAIQFITVPNANAQAIQLLNMIAQMVQMRTGITSAAQGEMKGVPSANTATGTRDIISRGATLIKWPIDTFKDDITHHLDFAVALIYANQDTDETFNYGEGEDAELLEIKRGDVRGLRMNITLTMTQSQSQTKLESANGAMDMLGKYLLIPEIDKAAARPLVIQGIKALGFNQADQIVRKPVTDVQGIAAILPPELQQPFLMWATQMGLVSPPAGPTAPAGPGGPTPAATPPIPRAA